jgi:MFS transporter, DHA2 family, glioxin efflux transporter
MDSEKQSTTKTSPGQPTSVEMTGKEAETDASGAFVAEEYPHGTRLAAIVMSLLLGMFLVALDNVRRIHPFLTYHRANPIYR